MIELCHLGEDCAPGIIIQDILKQKIKHLFMLGVYRFNDILLYLKDCNYERIYNKEDLIILENDVNHSKYNFIFNHDYKMSDGKIINYEFIRDRFDLKIKNFKEILSSDNLCLFIVFTHNLDTLKINEMIEWLSLNKKKFHLIIFTDTKNNIIDSHFCSIINLKNSYKGWWEIDNTLKMILYKEVYEKFINCINQLNIIHDFPSDFQL